MPLLELDVAGHRDQVLDPFRVEEGEQRRRGEAAIQADPERGRREGDPELGQQAAQDADRSQGRVGIAGRRTAVTRCWVRSALNVSVATTGK